MSRRRRAASVTIAGVLLASAASAFSNHPNKRHALSVSRKTISDKRPSSSLSMKANNDHASNARRAVGNVIATAALASAVAFSPLHSADAYDPSDYASETVTSAVSSLKEAEGDTARSFQAFEEIAAIIAEGKGIGGSVNYSKWSMRFSFYH